MYNAKKVCGCYGHKMGTFLAEKSQSFIPGFIRDSFDKEQMVPDTFSYIINMDVFQYMSNHEFQQCVIQENYNSSNR
jgi:hypothetical protein